MEDEAVQKRVNNNDLKNLIGATVVIGDMKTGQSKTVKVIEYDEKTEHVFVSHNMDQYWVPTIYDANLYVYTVKLI